MQPSPQLYGPVQPTANPKKDFPMQPTVNPKQAGPVQLRVSNQSLDRSITRHDLYS